MDLDIRKAVLSNLQGSSADEVMATINDSIAKEEKVLPGLGVLFEVFWRGASAEDKNFICNTIANNLKQ
jgi:small acid-soluble spore protein I (minor)